MTDPFKFVSLDDIRSLQSPIVCVITADTVQEFAEDNCGGPLTDDELRLFWHASLADFSGDLCPWLDESIEASRQWAQEEKAMDRQITELAVQGRSNAEIAEALMFPEPYVESRRQVLQVPTIAV